jgi:tetratricopeptide (TPR) repeat protein/GR25 family glycosyltransferase involved in LPS biosynthesis
LRRSRQLLVALNWQGNPLTEIQELKGRSLPLELLAPLAQSPAVELLALQHGAGLEQLSACSFRNRFHPEQHAVSQAADFRDTAAILACCDLLISSDTALVHLAGALGVPTWVLLHNTPDWRWGLRVDSSSWYPTLRLFRQEQPADWPSLIERVQTALERFCSEPPERSAALPRLTSMTFVDGWQQDVQALWDRDQRNEAIQLLLSRINGCLPDRPLIASKQFSLYLFLLGQHQACDQVLLELRQRWPDDLELLETQAVVRSRLGRHQEAVEGYEAVLRLRPDGASVNVWDGLANARSQLGHHSEAVAAGEQALRLKDAQTRPLPGWQLPTGSPQAWLERHPGASVIAFSLWGGNPRYLRGLLRNLLLIPALYPGWTARVYLDRSVPEEFRTLAESLGAQLCLQPDAASLRERLCWRFQVANDVSVGRFLVRDTDSVVNQREARAVQQWIDSDRWFHVMRDWWTHTDLVLAGMWGGVAGVLPDLTELLQTYTPAARETANVDQWFLRDCVWDALRRSVLSHDRYYRSLDSQPWPDPDPDGNQHVGQDEFSARRSQQRDWLWPWIQAYPCLQLPEDAEHLNATSKDAAAVPPGFVVHSVAWTAAGDAAASCPCLDNFSGYYINLEASVERRQAMDEQLARFSWGTAYSRFPAKMATTEEANSRGLGSAGELGIWRSTLALLENWLAYPGAPDDLLHILEDDAVLPPSLAHALSHVCRNGFSDWDLLFTESFLTVPLYRKMLGCYKRATSRIQLVHGGAYLACLSSYLLTRQSASRFLEQLRLEFEKPTLLPLDMVVRRLIRDGAMRALISLPFLTTVQTQLPSTIQGFRGAEVERSQHLDLYLRRMLYVDGLSDSAIACTFAEAMTGVSALFSGPEQQRLLAEILSAARASGLLKRY